MTDIQNPATLTPTDENGNPQLDHLAAPEHDPYFTKKDGTKVTGKPRGPDGKFQKAEAKAEPPKPVEPERDEPEPEEEVKAKEPEKDEKAQRIGDAWRELKAQKREMAAREASLNGLRAELEQQQKAIAEERAEMRANFRGWLQKQGLSFRQLVEEDLQEQDADPREKELRELRAEVRRLADEAEVRRKAEQERTAEQVTADEVQSIATTIEANGDQFPYLVAYGKEQAARELHQAWYHHLNTTGEQLDVYALFEQANKILEDNAKRLSSVGKQVAEVPATAARAESRNGSRVAEVPEATPDIPAPSTLTNRTAAQRASSVTARLSHEDRARAIGNSLLRVRD